MPKYKIDNEKKDFVGIGKIMIDVDPSITWNMPHLHFLVSDNLDYFEAICLEFGLVSTGESQEEATKRLVEQTIFYIEAVMYNGRGFEEFIEVSLNDFMSEYWNVYRNIEFYLAEQKRDLSHNIDRNITEAIQKTFDEDFKKRLKEKAHEAADEIIKEFDRFKALRLNSIIYTSVAA